MIIWTVFLLIAIAAVLVLVWHVTLEMNKLDKQATDLAQKIQERYGR